MGWDDGETWQRGRDDGETWQRGIARPRGEDILLGGNPPTLLPGNDITAQISYGVFDF